MSEFATMEPLIGGTQASTTMTAHAHQHESCEECLGSGGWFRYEPALEPSPGLLYLSCVQCRGSGRTHSAQA